MVHIIVSQIVIHVVSAKLAESLEYNHVDSTDSTLLISRPFDPPIMIYYLYDPFQKTFSLILLKTFFYR